MVEVEGVEPSRNGYLGITPGRISVLNIVCPRTVVHTARGSIERSPITTYEPVPVLPEPVLFSGALSAVRSPPVPVPCHDL